MKCFNCSKFGHISRDRPQKRTQVRQTERERQKFELKKEPRASTFADKARSLGVRTKAVVNGKKLLIGEKTCSWINMTEEGILTILDTGLIIIIIPVGVFARAKEKSVDIDSLEVITYADLKPLYDVFDNKMEFLGAIKV
ncbi:zinc knuckle [Oesophagostomum dentatum]|uniref:Zinc knuckle n=1 Tax=Oesophagostomum dentatum TaxID=61180 RepID=A0A0B1TP80_OESDE|nr:zinc knuckle [Oesophagostomum dentatum]